MEEAYLDNSATTRVCAEAAEKVMEMMTVKYGNPSSLHTKGLEAEQEVSAARASVAGMLGVKPEEIIFTSGGTEANNIALFGAAAAKRRAGNRIVSTAIEHPSVLHALEELEKQGFEVVTLKPDTDGVVPADSIIQAVTPDTILVSMMLVNNEVGSVQPVEAAAKAITACKAPALLHVDAVQAFGKLPVKPKKLGADLVTVSGHKIHAPKGVGALYIASGARILPRVFGGGQERGIRPGTESAPLIAGFGAAVRALPPLDEEYEQISALKQACTERLSQLAGIAFNSPANSLSYILNISVDGIRAETMLHHLASRGVYVSSGSACAKGMQSHVLSAMGLDKKRINSALRISFSRYNTLEDIEALVSALADGISTLAKGRM